MKRRLLTCMLAFVLTATVCCADDIDDLIETLKPSPLSYDAWAESLLEAASALQRKPTAQARVYAKAYEFGLRKPDGYPAAIRAARAAVELEGEDRAAWQQKLLDTLKRAWTAAPALEGGRPGAPRRRPSGVAPRTAPSRWCKLLTT